MSVTNVTDLRGVALKGRASKKATNEAFVGGAISGDNMTIVFRSQYREQISPRKWQRVNVTRIVGCERRWTPEHDDFWWEATKATSMTSRP